MVDSGFGGVGWFVVVVVCEGSMEFDWGDEMLRDSEVSSVVVCGDLWLCLVVFVDLLCFEFDECEVVVMLVLLGSLCLGMFFFLFVFI